MDNKFKRIRDEVIGMTMEIVGTVIGIEFQERGWSDKSMKFFNNTVADIRDRSLDKIDKIYKRKVSKT